MIARRFVTQSDNSQTIFAALRKAHSISSSAMESIPGESVRPSAPAASRYWPQCVGLSPLLIVVVVSVHPIDSKVAGLAVKYVNVFARPAPNCSRVLQWSSTRRAIAGRFVRHALRRLPFRLFLNLLVRLRHCRRKHRNGIGQFRYMPCSGRL
jgi:hypothetical protein